MVDSEETGLHLGYARNAGRRWNGPQKDITLSGSGYDMPRADWEGSCGVAAVNFVGE